MPPSAYVAMPLLREQRFAVAMTQVELALAAGTSATTIRRLEAGRTTRPELVARLSRFFESEHARWAAQTLTA